MPTYPLKPDYREDIDGLRAIAITLVLVFHFKLLNWLNGGFLGVDVFFTISGYIITRTYLGACLSGQFSLHLFWISRIRRLAPALVAAIALTMLVGFWRLFPTDLSGLAKQVIASQLYVSNVYYWQTVNYFGLQADEILLLHTWSLAVEEQYYLIYPLFLLAVARRWVRRPAPLLAAVAVLSFTIAMVMVTKKPEATFYLLPTRAWQFLVGAWLASATGSIPFAVRRSPALFIAGLVAVLGSAIVYTRGFLIPGYFALLPTLGTLALLLTGAHVPNRLRALLTATPVRYVGKISYPLYLVHWPVHVFLRDALDTGYDWSWRMIGTGMSVALAAAIYEGVERPIRKVSFIQDARTVLKAYGLALIVIGGACATILMAHGFPGRFSDQQRHYLAALEDRPPERAQCSPQAQATMHTGDMCLLGNLAKPATWAVLGDSHAWAAADAIDEWLKQRGESARFVFKTGCAPLLGVHMLDPAKDACFKHNQALFQAVLTDASLSHVFLISTWHQAAEALLTADPTQAPTREQSIEQLRTSLARTVAALGQAKKHTVIWAPLPGGKVNVPRFLAQHTDMAQSDAVLFSVQEYEAEQSYFFDALNPLRPQIAGVFEPARLLCESGRCQVTHRDRSLYYDNAHLCKSATPIFSEALSAQLNPLMPAPPAAGP